MKRTEKSRQSRQKIIDGALNEFGAKGYALGSVNSICSDAAVSKGNMYHYFADKDALYLACVEECFDRLTGYLKAKAGGESKSPQMRLEAYFSTRLAFFEENPNCLRLFSEASVSPPEHLADEIKKIKSGFDLYNISVLTGLLEKVKLKPDMSLPRIVEVFRLFQDFTNTQYRIDPEDKNSVIRHEEICKDAVNIMLYGVVEKE